MKIPFTVNRKLVGALMVAALVLGVPATALALTLRPHGVGRPAPPSATSRGVAQIGALYPEGSQTHECTASVIDSPKGNTIMTAAHCISGSGAGMTFVPAERAGQAPYGRWTVTAAHVTRGWVTQQDPRDDVAFLTVAPQQIKGRTTEIQKVTGGYKLGPTARAGERVRITGYPEGTDNDAVTCMAKIYETHGYPSFDCTGYADGTSGSPWVLSTRHGAEVVGVIGGLHQGGCVDNTSYSPTFSASVQQAYRLASMVTDPDSVPTAGGDGC